MSKSKYALHAISKKKLSNVISKRLATVIMEYCHSLESLASVNELLLHAYLFDRYARRKTLRKRIHAARVWAGEGLQRVKEREKSKKIRKPKTK